MPIPISWTLIGGALVPTPAIGSGVGGSAVLPPPLTSFVQQDFLDLFDRLFPLHWLSPIKDPGPGYEVLQSYARLFERLSVAVCTFGADAFISSAQGGALATGEVEFYRADGNADLFGSAASVTAVGGGKTTITGLADVTPDMVGLYLTLSNCASPANNGSWLITDFLSSSSVQVALTGSAPDGNNGNIRWSLGTPVTVRAGSVVTTSRSGRDFTTTSDALFYPGELGPITVAVQATAYGYEWNVPGEVITADGTALPGEIDTIKTLIESPVMGDINVRVRQLVATSGGRDAALDALGRDRGFERAPSEADSTYRGRVSALPDTISLGAVERACLASMRSYDANYEIIETWEMSYQTCWDAPNATFPGSNFDTTCFVYDDPRAPIPFRGRWLDESEHRGAFIVVVENIQPLSDTGMVYDDSAMTRDALMSPNTGGRRALGAFDVDSYIEAFGYLQGSWDGYDGPHRALYKGLYDKLQSLKAAGVAAILERKGA